MSAHNIINDPTNGHPCGLSVRAANCVSNFLHKRFFSEDDLLSISAPDFLRSQGVGRKVWIEVNNARDLILLSRSKMTGQDDTNLYNSYKLLQDRVAILENKLKQIGHLL